MVLQLRPRDQATIICLEGFTPDPREAQTVEKCQRFMAVIFFDSDGIFYKHMVPQGTTVTRAAHIVILTGLREAIRRKRPRLLALGWRLLHDNAPSHLTHRAAVPAKHNIEDLPTHPIPLIWPTAISIFSQNSSAPFAADILATKKSRTGHPLSTPQPRTKWVPARLS